MSTPQPVVARPDGSTPPSTWIDRLIQRALAVSVTAIVTAICLLVLLFMLADRHTTGGEIDGVIVAGLGVLTGILSLAFLGGTGRSRGALGILVVLWLAVAIGGLSGYHDHSLAVTAASADLRARPSFAPLLFSVLGLIGGAALLVRRR